MWVGNHLTVGKPVATSLPKVAATSHNIEPQANVLVTISEFVSTLGRDGSLVAITVAICLATVAVIPLTEAEFYRGRSTQPLNPRWAESFSWTAHI